MAVCSLSKVVFISYIIFFIHFEIQAKKNYERRRTSRTGRTGITKKRIKISCSPKSCGISPWDNWGECYTSCGEGTKSRYRHVVASAICGGSCKYSLRENAICYDFTERHCKVGLWSAWPTCVGVCPGEAVRRSRYKTIRERCVACTYETWDQKICNGTGWTNWSTCNATCGLNGTTTRTNRCLGPTTLVEQLDCFGTCCSDSCSRSYYEIGELPDCKCVVNKTHWIWRKSSSAYLGNQYCKHVLPILGIWSLLYIGYS